MVHAPSGVSRKIELTRVNRFVADDANYIEALLDRWVKTLFNERRYVFVEVFARLPQMLAKFLQTEPQESSRTAG